MDLGLLYLAKIPHLFLGHSDDGRSIAMLLGICGLISLVIFGVVAGTVVRYTRNYAAKAGDDSTFREAQDEGKIESKFAILFLVLVIALGSYGLTVTWNIDSVTAEKQQQPDLIIVGHQWWWEIRYPGSDAVTANIAHIPTGKRLLVAIESADVVHDWWVSGLGRKMDAVPGRTNYFWIQADQPGVFEGACNEFCGTQHAWMRMEVVAEPEEQFQAWLESQALVAQPAVGDNAKNGSLLFNEMSCATCHSIRGTTSEAGIGPDLTHVASRSKLLAGKITYSKENLKAWLSDPQAVKPGAHMPRFIFSEKELDDLTDYLDGLK